MSRDVSRPVAVHSLDHFTLAVPDLTEAERFYSSFGLDVDHKPEGLSLRTSGDTHVWADIVQAPRKRLMSIRLGVYDQDMPVFAERLAGLTVAPEEEDTRGNSLWVRAPDGLMVEIAVTEKRSPDSKSYFGAAPRREEYRGAGPRSSVLKVRPRRLSHLAMFTDDVPRAMEFYSRYLGVRLSDRSGNDVAFMHGAHGSEHHMIAFARSDGPGLHHCSWEVSTVDEVGQGAEQMQAAGYTRGWGVGRHVLGSNYFYYARDPWGSYSEYSADMDYIPADIDWVGKDNPGEDSFYQWGPPPPEDFISNYETMAPAE